MHLHCTKKLMDQLGLLPAELEASSPSNRILSWHAHIVFIARSKTLIAVNDQTFYAIIMPRMKKKSLERFVREGGWDRIDIMELTKEINRTPWLAGSSSCVFPIKKITDDLKVLLY